SIGSGCAGCAGAGASVRAWPSKNSVMSIGDSDSAEVSSSLSSEYNCAGSSCPARALSSLMNDRGSAIRSSVGSSGASTATSALHAAISRLALVRGTSASELASLVERHDASSAAGAERERSWEAAKLPASIDECGRDGGTTDSKTGSLGGHRSSRELGY